MLSEHGEELAQVADDKLKSCGAIFYDSEIISCIPLPGEMREPDLHYCRGWDDHAGMGISVITVYDFVRSAYRVFLQDNMGEFKRMIESRNIIIGYVNHRFDDKLAAANNIVIPRAKSYDMWKEITDTQPPGQKKGFTLNEMLAANHLEKKSGEGGDAPKLAQRGHWGSLINYCLDDTRLSVLLLRLLCNNVLIHPKNGGYMTVAKPWEVIKVEAGESLF